MSHDAHRLLEEDLDRAERRQLRAEREAERDKKNPYPEQTNPKDLLGVKKAPIHLVPPALVIETAPAMANGAAKYGPYNWREKAVKFSIYYAAAMRHLAAAWDGEDIATDSGVDHLAHASACLAIIFDARSIGKLVDDRPTRGGAAALMTAQDRSAPAPELDPAEILATKICGVQYIRPNGGADYRPGKCRKNAGHIGKHGVIEFGQEA